MINQGTNHKKEAAEVVARLRRTRKRSTGRTYRVIGRNWWRYEFTDGEVVLGQGPVVIGQGMTRAEAQTFCQQYHEQDHWPNGEVGYEEEWMAALG